MVQRQRSIPSLPRFPLLGNVFALRNNRLELLLRISHEFGDMGAFHFGPFLVPLLNAPELIRSVLVDQGAAFEKTATVRTLATPILGNGVFLSEGEKHRKQRSVLAPLFQHRRVLDYAETIMNHTFHLQETWLEGATINLADEMTCLTLSVITDILFGTDVSGEERELGEALTSVFRHFTNVITNPIRLPQSWPTPRNRRAHQIVARLNATISRMIEEQRQSGEERNDFLSMMLHAQDDEHASPLRDQQVRDEALSLFIAGHRTMADALTWSWYLLSQHPEVYAQLKAEGNHILAGRLPSITDLPNLPYTLQVWKEALRLYPPVYAFTRRTIAPVQIGAYHIPRGVSVVISPYTLHRRPHVFPDPEQFNPERFAPQQEQRLERYSYMPFGAGAHSCLGMPFAQLEGHLILATLAQRVTFQFAGPKLIEPEPLLTLRPKGEVLMKVSHRIS